MDLRVYSVSKLRASALILFNRPVNNVKTSPGSGLPGSVMKGWGSSSVITPVGNQRSAELKQPIMVPSQADPRSNTMPPTETPAPARCAPASRCRLKCSRLLVPHSGAGERGAFPMIIMLLGCHLQHKTGGLNIPPTRKRFLSLLPSSSN